MNQSITTIEQKPHIFHSFHIHLYFLVCYCFISCAIVSHVMFLFVYMQGRYSEQNLDVPGVLLLAIVSSEGSICPFVSHFWSLSTSKKSQTMHYHKAKQNKPNTKQTAMNKKQAEPNLTETVNKHSNLTQIPNRSSDFQNKSNQQRTNKTSKQWTNKQRNTCCSLTLNSQSSEQVSK